MQSPPSTSDAIDRAIAHVVRDWTERYELTAAESFILSASAHGWARRDIVAARQVSHKTIKVQVSSLLLKVSEDLLSDAVVRVLHEAIEVAAKTNP